MKRRQWDSKTKIVLEGFSGKPVSEDDGFQERCIDIAKKMSPVLPNVIDMTKRLLHCDLEMLETYFEMEARLATKHRNKLPAVENDQ